MIRINGTSYNVMPGFTTTYTLDKSLDFGSFVIPILNQKDQFPMYSDIEITRDNGTIENFLLIGDIVELASHQPKLYSHTIQFVEYTKKLENYLISAAAFTQPTDGSIRYNYDDVLQRLINISIFEKTNLLSTFVPCTLDSSVVVALGNMKAPEFFFNNMTLREAIDEVLSSVYGIARLKKINGNDVLFVDFFDETINLINETDILTYYSEQNINNYATTMVSDVSNAIRESEGIASTIIYPSSHSWSPLKTPAGFGIIDDINSVMDLEQPIYDVLKVDIWAIISFQMNTINYNKVEVKFDLSDYVFTKEQYDGLPVSWPYRNPAITQQNSFWFNTGDRFIQGLTVDWESGAFTTDVVKRRALENAIATEFAKLPQFTDKDGNVVAMSQFRDLVIGDATGWFNDKSGWEDLQFRVEFIPQERLNRIEVEKEDLSNFHKEAKMYFRQSASLINLNHYTKKMNQDLQRLGEEKFSFDTLHTSFANIFNIGDFTDDKHILMARTVVDEIDYIFASYDLSRNYQQINEFIGVDKAQDRFALVGREKVLNRQLVYKDYVMLSDQTYDAATVATTEIPLLNTTGRFQFVNSFINNVDLFLESSLIKNTNASPSPKILSPLILSTSGENALLSFGFTHNAIAGYQIKEDQEDEAFLQEPIFYAPDGLMDEIEFEFISGFNNEYLTYSEIKTEAQNLPVVTRVDYTPFITTGINTLYINKDPGEVLNRISYQLQAVKHPNFVDQFIIGNYFHSFNNLFNDNPQTYYIYGSGTLYNKNEKEQIKASATSQGQLIGTISGPNDFDPILNISNNVSAFNSYAIADANGRLILAVNKINNYLPTQIKFTFTHQRVGLNKL
jgi:hypothetical protein